MNQRIAHLFHLQGFVVYRWFESAGSWIVKVGRPKREARCERCRSLSRRLHQVASRPRRVLHSTVEQRHVFLEFTSRRFWCASCKRPFTEKLPGLERWSRRTSRADWHLLQRLQEGSFRAVQRAYGTGYQAVRASLNRQITGPLDLAALFPGDEPIALGIDEHSFRGTDLVITVTVIKPKRQLVAILEDDRQRTLVRYLTSLPMSVKERICAVCIDMKRGYRTILEKHLPKARIVLDKFHVIQDANFRMEVARRLEQEMRRIAIPRWPLLKRPEKLSSKQQRDLDYICVKYPNIRAFYRLREDVRDLYAAPTLDAAAAKLTRLMINAEAGSDLELRKWARTLREWRKEILAHFEIGITNGFTEGCHTKIKQLKRLSYGFRNVQVYIRKMLLAFIPTIAPPVLHTY